MTGSYGRIKGIVQTGCHVDLFLIAGARRTCGRGPASAFRFFSAKSIGGLEGP
jgi:hypothetical protein